jgi:hypothetical protein
MAFAYHIRAALRTLQRGADHIHYFDDTGFTADGDFVE